MGDFGAESAQPTKAGQASGAASFHRWPLVLTNDLAKTAWPKQLCQNSFAKIAQNSFEAVVTRIGELGDRPLAKT